MSTHTTSLSQATFPLPNTAVTVDDEQGIVVASVHYYDDDRGAAYTLLLLFPESPYFAVAIAEPADATDDFNRPGETETMVVTAFERHHNIVPAVETYEQWGGGY